MDTSNTDSTTNLAGMHSLNTKSCSERWIIDSGCTDHICNNIVWFHTVQDISHCKHRITTPDGTSHKVNQQGNVQLTNNLLLKNVLYVPEFKFNLIFVHKLCTDLVVSVIFSSTNCFLQDPLMRLSLPLGNLEQGMYYTTFTNKNAVLKHNDCQTHAGLVT